MGFCKCKLFFNIIINRSQVSKRQFGLKQWTVRGQVLLDPFDEPLFLWKSISQEQSEQRDQSRFVPRSRIFPKPILDAKRWGFWKPSCTQGGGIWPNQGRNNQRTSVKSWWQTETRTGKMKRCGNGVRQIFSTSLWGRERKKRRRREWGGVCRAIWDEIRGERSESGGRGGRGGMSNWDNDQQWWEGFEAPEDRREEGRRSATLSRQEDRRERQRK